MAQHAAILDIDGTLVDSNYEHVRAWYEAFERHGITVPQAWIHRSIGMGGDQLMPHLLGWDDDDPRAKAISQTHDALFRQQYLEGIRPLPGVAGFFDRLEQTGHAIALATSAKPDELGHYVRLLGLDGRLAATVSKGDVAETKPAPDIFAIACRKLAIDPSAAIALGDSVWDAEAARRIGMRCLGVCTGGFAQAELCDAGAEAVYRDLPALLESWDQSPFAGR